MELEEQENLICRSTWRWRTMDGKSLTIDEMETSHIFNAMKMIFNHLADEFGGEPVWFGRMYDGCREHAKMNKRNLAATVVMFGWVIEERGDLPDKYWAPYLKMVEQIFPKKYLSNYMEVLPVGEN